MFYFVTAHKVGRKDLQEIFYPGQEHEMHCWMDTLADYGFTVTMKEMKRNQKW